MLFALLSLVLVAGAGRAAWLLAALWRRLPRSNADFGL
jgi:hypothetical protein